MTVALYPFFGRLRALVIFLSMSPLGASSNNPRIAS